MKTVAAIRHVAFEDLGSFASVLAQRGFDLRYLEAGVDRLDDLDPGEPDLLVVLGGAGISIPDLRAESARLAPTLEQQGRRFFDAWLTAVDDRP
jgi:hypothetical protein